MLRHFLILLVFAVCSSSALAKNDSIVAQEKHDPKKATLYSAVLPGLGQAYNKKYWKVPVVYAGIGTISYFIITNNNGYKDYRDAYDYKSGTSTDANKEIIDIANKYSSENLITIRDYYRRNMELSWIILALWYGINIIDATVGDDLSLKVEPIIQPNYETMAYGYGRCSTGVSLKLKF